MDEMRDNIENVGEIKRIETLLRLLYLAISISHSNDAEIRDLREVRFSVPSNF